MDEPVKPFACTLPECGMTFTNEDHLHVHSKKHDMVLQLGSEQKAAFVADQTPTPTRFIRNCEEVGLFQDLQNVAANPFDEGFKRAMEAKSGILSLESSLTPTSADDVLHTPQMVFPMLDSGDATLFTNNQRNVTISRSSSDESGTIKEFETRTISKLTNQVRTISRIVNEDVTVKHSDTQTDVETVSYKNNIITVESNIICKDDCAKIPIRVYSDTVTKETNSDNKIDATKLQVEKVPIMSQKSIDFVVDSLTSELGTSGNQNVIDINGKAKSNGIINVDLRISRNVLNQKLMEKKRRIEKSNMRKQTNILKPKILPKINEKQTCDSKNADFEVTIKLPNGKHVKMKPVEEVVDAREVIRHNITKKITEKISNKVIFTPATNVVKIPTGTLIPVTLVNKNGAPLSSDALNKVPITKINNFDDIVKVSPPKKSVKLFTVAKNINTAPIIQNLDMEMATLTKNNTCNIKVSEPYQIDKVAEKRKPTELEEAVCLTEEDISQKLLEHKKKVEEDDDDCVLENVSENPEMVKRTKIELESRCAASRRYRERLKVTMQNQSEENRKLREANQKLIAEKAVLRLLIMDHMKKCPHAEDMGLSPFALHDAARRGAALRGATRQLHTYAARPDAVLF